MKKVQIIIISVLFSGIIAFLLFSLIMYFMFNNLQRSNSHEINTSKKKLYQIETFHPKTNSTSLGVVRIHRTLKPNEFITYSQPDGGFSVISQFSNSKKYECTGSCYCGSERRSTIALSRSLFFMISAISTIMAVNLASKYFKEECSKLAEGVCDDDFWDNGMEADCHERFYKKYDMSGELDENVREYFCSGHCVEKPVSTFGYSEVKVQKMARADQRKSKCDSHMTTSWVYVDERIEIMPRTHSLIEKEAEFLFKKNYLEPYCKSFSKWDDRVEVDMEKSMKTKSFSVHDSSVYLCTGYDNTKHGDNVLCLLQPQMKPEDMLDSAFEEEPKPNEKGPAESEWNKW